MKTESRADGTIPGRSEVIFGRNADLAWLEELATATPGASTLVCILGAGGLGKTRLIEAFATRLEQASLPFAPLIDFYHIDSFRAGVVEHVIATALARTAPEHAHLLRPYLKARQRLERSRIGGQEFDQAQRAVRRSFITCYNQVAAALARAQRRMVLLFDTVEQAISLSDGAERHFDLALRDASIGGEHWLRATLPKLHNTLIVLGGRPETLYGQPVSLYAELGALIERRDHELSGLSYSATVELARDMLARASASNDEQTAGIAAAIDLDDPAKLRAWYQISEGLPFWIAILFTLELIGSEPEGVLSALQEEAGTFAPEVPIAAERREALRNELRECFLGEITQAAPPLLVALQCMASLRKGLTPALLDLVLDRLDVGERPPELFERLRTLAVVKTRRAQRYTSRGTRPDDLADQETMLFLHDELYAWLDRHPMVADESRQLVRTAVFDWYEQAIAQAEAERLAAAEALLVLARNDPAVPQRDAERNDAQRRKRQLQRDLLGYAYEGGAAQRGQAAAQLQILAYEAIFARDAGHETALHQEALRNLYRQAPALSAADELAFAALWLLRSAVQYEDVDRTRQLLERLDRLADQRGQCAGADRALFELATAIARLYSGGGTRPDDRILIDTALKTAEQAIDAAEAAQPDRSPAERQWLLLLRTQVLNFRGYLHRLNYELDDAIRCYRASVRISRREEGLLPQLRATTLNNLAFALSEQGDTEEAQRIAHEALAIRLRYGTAYDVAYSRNVLARILLRAGEPFRARHYAELAARTMRVQGGARGRLHNLRVLAETHRKVAELLDDTPPEQDRCFTAALMALDEGARVLARRKRPDPATEWVLLQTRGCVHRSRAVALLRRGDAYRETAAREFGSARHWLEQALQVAEAHHEPALIRMDIIEDLAAVSVHEDEYGQQLYRLIDTAEHLAPTPYRAQEGVGPVEMEHATRGYWRELGQCRLQRMLSAFGKFDFGAYSYPPEYEPEPASGRHVPSVAPGEEAFLDEAAEHMVIMLAYLVRYNRHSWMLVTARRLALRELLLNRTPAQLDRFASAAYEAARRYNLLFDESFAVAERVIAVARANLDPDG